MVEQEHEISPDIANLFKNWESQEMTADGKSRLNPEASEFVPGGKSEKSLNPEASEFVPGAPPQPDISTPPGSRPEHVGRVIMVNHQQGWAMLQSHGLDNLFCYLSQVREPTRLREGMMVIFEVVAHQGGRPMVLNVRQYMGEGKGKGKGKGMFPPFDAWAEWFAKGKGKGADMDSYMMGLMGMYGKGKGKGEDPYANEEFRKFMMARGMDPMAHWRSRMAMGPRGMMYPPKMPPVRRRDPTQGMMQLFQAMSSQSNKSDALQKMLQSLLSNPSVFNQISSNPNMQNKLHSLVQFLAQVKGEKGEGKGAPSSTPEGPTAAAAAHGAGPHGPGPHGAHGPGPHGAHGPGAQYASSPHGAHGGSPSKMAQSARLNQIKDQQKFYGSVLREACADPVIQQLLRSNKQAQLILHSLITGGPSAVQQFRDNAHAKLFLHSLHKAMKEATTKLFERSQDGKDRVNGIDVAAAANGIDHMFAGMDMSISSPEPKDISKLLEQTRQNPDNDALASVLGSMNLEEEEDSLENVLNAAAEAAGTKDAKERQNSNLLDSFKKNEPTPQPTQPAAVSTPEETAAGNGLQRITAIVTSDFESGEERQLSVKAGTPVIIVKVAEDWSYGMLRDGTNGWFPSRNWAHYDTSAMQHSLPQTEIEEGPESPEVGPTNVVDDVSNEAIQVVWDGPRPAVQEVVEVDRVWSRQQMLAYRNLEVQTQPAVISHIKVVQAPEKKRRRRDKEEKDEESPEPEVQAPPAVPATIEQPEATSSVDDLTSKMQKHAEWWNTGNTGPSSGAETAQTPEWSQSIWASQWEGQTNWDESWGDWWKQSGSAEAQKPWTGGEEWPEWWEGGEDSWEKEHLAKAEQYNSIKEDQQRDREGGASGPPGTTLRSRNNRLETSGVNSRMLQESFRF